MNPSKLALPSHHIDSLFVPPHRIHRHFLDHESGTRHDGLESFDSPVSLDLRGLTSMLYNKHVCGNSTLFQGVECLPGGALVTSLPPSLLPAHLNPFDFAWRIEAGRWQGASEETLIREGKRRFMQAVDRLYRPDQDVVVPLSGGVDSRAILGALMEMVSDVRKIKTYTYGHTGSDDFDLGNLIARRVGTTHTVLDMEQVRYDAQTVRQTARLHGANTTLLGQPYMSHHVVEHFGHHATYWSGFPGDLWGGSYSSISPSTSVAAARHRFLNRLPNRQRCLDINRHHTPQWRQDTPLSWGGIYEDATHFDEQVVMLNHVERFTTHHNFRSDCTYACPYMDNDFVAFWLSIDYAWRPGNKLYNDIMRLRFPALFEIPVQSRSFINDASWAKRAAWRTRGVGRKILWRATKGRVSHPDAIHLDFHHVWRSQPDLKKIGNHFLHRLCEHEAIDQDKVWQMWNDYFAGDWSLGHDLVLLVSLGAIFEEFDMSNTLAT